MEICLKEAQPSAEVSALVDGVRKWTNFEQNQCLGFLNRQNKWVCEDPCLTNKNGQLCGTTDHFTNFALLLTGANARNKNNDPCASSVSTDYVLAYVSLSLVATAICITIISVVLIEIKMRVRRIQKKRLGNVFHIEVTD